MVQPYISKAILKHKLPPDFSNTVNRWYFPLANKIVAKYHQQKTPLIVGIQGAQGSGKSTLSDFLKLIFKHEHTINCAVLSIDDFYLTRFEREQLATNIHPLFKTRGVPGTHSIALANKTLDNLLHLNSGECTALPSFSKVTDDRIACEQWPVINGPIDIIILEGWCVGLQAQLEAELSEPVNALETTEDPNGIWRRYVNKQLRLEYQTLFSRLDCLAVLNAPSFDCVFKWRLLQEEKLAATLEESGYSSDAQKLLTEPQIKQFIAHYQRLTEHALRTLPKAADWVISLDVNHNIMLPR